MSEQGGRTECGSCGRVETDPSVRFCPRCGAPLRGEPARQKLRRRLAGLFVFLTVLSLVVTVVGAWARAVALDTDRFVATVGPVIDEPSVQRALSVRLTDRVMEGLQVQDRVASALSGLDAGELPISPALLASPIADGICSVLLKRIEQATASDAVRTLWYEVLARAHSQAIALLRGETTNATIEDDTVYINLLPFTNDALASLEPQLSEIFNRTIDLPAITTENVSQAVGLLEQQFGVDLPDDFGQIKVFESDALPAAQAGIAATDRLIYALAALTVVLAIIALVLSPRRLRTTLWLGLGAALGLIVVRRLALRLDDAIVERVSGETNQAAVGAVTGDVFQDLRNFTTLMLVAAIVIGVGAYLAGRPPWLRSLIERASSGTLAPSETGPVRWIGDHATMLQVVTVTLGALVLFFADLGWAALLIVLVLVAAAWFTLTYLRELVGDTAEVA